ncbi:L,D-transpeptidase [Actinoplanes sp. URMC 104]|uniref:L,D-transpeptidase n=1 Tax=Actinoplanes sp. URMC 104 TaxID=3423409 RepID=UPI003F1DB0CC
MAYTRRAVAGGLIAAALGASLLVAHDLEAPTGAFAARRVPAPAPAVKAAVEPIPRAARPPQDLPRINYWDAPRGFPRDAATDSDAVVDQRLRPLRKVAVYDRPGGRPRAFLQRSISGLPVTVPIVQRRRGWVAVLLPSVNRRVGWVPDGGWQARPLRDRLVADLSERRLTWFRDGRRRAAWTVAVGSSRTPTPVGRTYVMGRTVTHGEVYAGLDALVLGAVPDDRDALSDALRNGHTAIHGWRDESAFGRSVSNGCIRVPAEVQRTLLRSIGAGTVVQVVP